MGGVGEYSCLRFRAPLALFLRPHLQGRCRGRSPLPGYQGCPLAFYQLPSLQGVAGGGSFLTVMLLVSQRLQKLPYLLRYNLVRVSHHNRLFAVRPHRNNIEWCLEQVR